MSDIFLSYAREDLERAKRLAKALEVQGWSVFWDQYIPPGKTWQDVIGSALQEARCVIVCWSEVSVGKEWVREEAEEGKERKVLVPILFDKVKPPMGFRSIQAASLVDWNGTPDTDAFRQLISAIGDILGPPEQPAAQWPPPQGSENAESEAADKSEPPALQEPPIKDKKTISRIAGLALALVIAGFIAIQMSGPEPFQPVKSAAKAPRITREETPPESPQPVKSVVVTPEAPQKAIPPEPKTKEAAQKRLVVNLSPGESPKVEATPLLEIVKQLVKENDKLRDTNAQALALQSAGKFVEAENVLKSGQPKNEKFENLIKQANDLLKARKFEEEKNVISSSPGSQIEVSGSWGVGDVIGTTLSAEEYQLYQQLEPKERPRFLDQKRIQDEVEKRAQLVQQQINLLKIKHDTSMGDFSKIN